MAARRAGRSAASTPAIADSTVMTSNRTGAGSKALKPWSRRLAIMAPATTRPISSPSTVPSTAMITDSQRIIERTWERTMPTARNSPTSRVRSKIDSASVLAMPNRAMNTARARNTYNMFKKMSICAVWLLTNADRSFTSAPGKSPRTPSISDFTLPTDAPSATWTVI